MSLSRLARLPRRRVVAAACCAAALAFVAPVTTANAAPARKWVRFAKGKLEVELPENLQARETGDGTLTATFGPGGTHRLELTLLDQTVGQTPGDTAEMFVEYYARQRKLTVHTNGDKAVVMEGAEGTLEGKPVRIARWQIGFGKSLVVMTLTAPAEKAMSPSLEQFLARDLEPLIASVRRRG
jgi:hypothetical protein